ncbi:aminotransferase class I/II-fold pyridoxal phosphate-dependent enzyme [[Mycoplasma] testudinis]|uniref:aminotransferase class I/II-fold pyridoxal phosphate-dependent enzyme n=1 Tax=[Mycoplasma] testudinis TaxID=33924 RepID=UPI000A041C8C|nr:pyridoxal phosphate-dependent aminotransferase family protein [[Mycoplasma] testudinis]
MKDIFDKCYQISDAKLAKSLDIYPYFHQLESKQDTIVKMQGHEVIMLGSNNYLSLTSHSEVIEAGINAFKNYGSGVSGSRFLNGTTDLHINLEQDLASFLKKPRCLIFSSGYTTNLGVLSCIASRSDVILCDRENHASIYDGIKLGNAKFVRYYHSDMEDLEMRLKEIPETSGALIITDGVFSMSGEICKLPEIVALAKKYGAKVMVDDAHGLGVLGKNGRGTAEHFGLEDDVDLIMGTFSKTLASIGGYVCGSKEVIEFIMHQSRPFIFSAALPPSAIEAARCALGLLIKNPALVKKVNDISNYARTKMLQNNLKIGGHTDIPIIPIYSYGKMRTLLAAKILFEQGVYVNPVIPPATSENECLLRTSYQAEHTKEQIDKAIGIITKVLSDLPVTETEVLDLLTAQAKNKKSRIV